MTDDHNSLRSKKRRAENELLFRKANEQMQSMANRLHDKDEKCIFLCECSSDECFKRLPVPLGKYEELATADNRFIVVRGHEKADLERVVKQGDDYLVVEKLPELA